VGWALDRFGGFILHDEVMCWELSLGEGNCHKDRDDCLDYLNALCGSRYFRNS
jgi:hypothetical protein